MKFKMVHNNINVMNIENSMKFYKDALGLEETSRIEEDGFTIVYLGNSESLHLLELTEFHDHPQAYDLGENEFHLAFETDDYDGAHRKHKEMDCIVFENPHMGIYFITDPDGYWLEIIPSSKN